MEVKVLSKGKNELLIEVVGEDHTLGNLVAKEAIKHPKVRNAYYRVPHPLRNTIEIYILVEDGADLKSVIEDICRNIKRSIDEFRREIEAKID